MQFIRHHMVTVWCSQTSANLHSKRSSEGNPLFFIASRWIIVLYRGFGRYRRNLGLEDRKGNLRDLRAWLDTMQRLQPERLWTGIGRKVKHYHSEGHSSIKNNEADSGPYQTGVRIKVWQERINIMQCIARQHVKIMAWKELHIGKLGTPLAFKQAYVSGCAWGKDCDYFHREKVVHVDVKKECEKLS